MSGIQSSLLVRLRQRQVRDSIERERELRLELNHRVKNILASVTSIFQMTRRGAATFEDLAVDFTGRLRALSNVHTAVFEAGGEEVSLSAIANLTVTPYNSDGVSLHQCKGPGHSCEPGRLELPSPFVCTNLLRTPSNTARCLILNRASISFGWWPKPVTQSCH
ncbi:hypothetical protein LP421_30180 (plasmid) [Rhizobium sp. RCAM05350]|nr:hypothetical protein LP421_30180 [Rhizobium sp. RCAM05350]